MKFPRRAGILLHPTSLPGPFGIGTLGPEAFRFVDWLADGGQRLWQVLPLGPTGYGDSPYQTFSSFAGNPLLISLERLAEAGWMPGELLESRSDLPPGRVDYGEMYRWKMPRLREAFNGFRREPHPAFEGWVAEQSGWLEDYALFASIKGEQGGGPWTGWPAPLRDSEPEALDQARARLDEEIAFRRFLQFVFFQQWITLRAYAHHRGIAIVGDVPIYVAHDSADTWAHRDAFYLNPDGTLALQAGVPPDYFSETGQLWGNPLYRWEVMADRGFDWWVARLRATLNLVDIVRLDHFRGFEAYWAVPGDAPTAVTGTWEPGPGADLFQALHDALGDLPIIAENLGVITPQVEAIRHRFAYPGMRVFQFAFTADTTSEFLPHNYVPNSVAYTGTHDNETSRGWFESLDWQSRRRVLAYVDADPEGVVYAMIRWVTASVADTVIVPLQDVLDLGGEARMNRPGEPGGNWQWRLEPHVLTPEHAAWLAEISALYGRAPGDAPGD